MIEALALGVGDNGFTAASPQTPVTFQQLPAGAAHRLQAAREFVRAALDDDSGRSRHLLPQFADMPARRTAQRDRPLDRLAAALPQLSTRFGPPLRKPSTSVADPAPPGADAERALMILDGPVEIVILGR